MKQFNCIASALVFLVCSTVGFQVAQAEDLPYEKEMSRGLSQMRRKDYPSAVATFTQILVSHPNVYEAYLNRAKSQIELKDWEGALNDFNEAIKINSNVVESYISRGDLQLNQGDTQAAIADYTQALRLNPKNIEAYLRRAGAYKQSGDYNKATQEYSSILNLAPRSMDARRERADCRALAGDLDGAIDDYNYLLQKFKASAGHLHYNLGDILLSKGDKDSAKQRFDEAIAFHSKNLKHSSNAAWHYFKRALSYSKIDEQDKALCDLEEAVLRQPNNANTQYYLGHLRLAKGDTKGAITALDEALRTNPKLSLARIDRAAACIAQGEFKTAQKDLDTALAGEKTSEGYINRSMARLALGDSSGAVADIQQAKILNPKSIEQRKQKVSEMVTAKESNNDKDLVLAQSFEQLALMELADNNVDNAESLVKRAIRIEEKYMNSSDPKLSYTLMLLGRVYLRKNAPLKAEALFRAAMLKLKNNPDGTQKYAIFNLEDCAKVLIQASSYEDAGAILVDTRMARAVSTLDERAFTGELSRKAERAIEAYKKKVALRQEESEQKVSAEKRMTVEEAAASVPEPKLTINRPIKDKWALIVGVSIFKDPSINLRFCAKDAKDFSEFLVKEKNFAPDHIQLLTDSSATRANILSMLGNKWLPRVAAPDDLVVIYFSSHGSPSSLDVGGVNYLVAHDTDVNDLYSTGIAFQDLSRIIKERVHCDRVICLLDACHSGVAAPSAKGLVKAANVNVDLIVQGTGQLVLSSSSPNQRSWESKRYQGSVFTRHLIEGLRKNGVFTKLGDAFSYLHDEVQREVLRDRGVLQDPIMKSKWEGTDLIIGAPPAAPSIGLIDIELPDSAKTSNKPGRDKAKASAAKHVK